MADHVYVRMYNVGFGDAFLITVPRNGDQGPFRILVDCGSIKKNQLAMDKIVKQIVTDVTRDDGVPRIDIVIATHRHADHVSGFSRADWDQVEVGEVWMPWTEDPQDKEARRIRNAQSRLALALNSALSLKAAALTGVERTVTEGYAELALNALSNEAAMRTLHRGFLGNPKRRFLPEANRGERPIALNRELGLMAHIMGPSRKEAVIRDMDPDPSESYLRLKREMKDEFDQETTQPPEPFAAQWRTNMSDRPRLSPADEEAIQRLAEFGEELLAASLDKSVNGTSLMIMLEIGSAYLLLPGDAQWGTWNAALQVPRWREMMSRINFYKVGHHGSHNATPVSFLDGAGPKDFWAMTSTARMTQWPNIPHAPLFTQLLSKTKKSASSLEEADVPGAYFKVKRSVFIEAKVPYR